MANQPLKRIAEKAGSRLAYRYVFIIQIYDPMNIAR
jgi:hypothetical protein